MAWEREELLGDVLEMKRKLKFELDEDLIEIVVRALLYLITMKSKVFSKEFITKVNRARTQIEKQK